MSLARSAALLRVLTLGLLLAAFGAIGSARAQNHVCPTAPNGDATNRCASTKFVQNAFAGGSALGLPTGEIFIGSPAGAAAAQAVSGTGDCSSSLSSAGVFTYTCTKLNGVTPGAMFSQNVAAGGDLSGNWPSPTVAKIGGVAVGSMATQNVAAGGDLSGNWPSPTVAKVQGLPWKASSYAAGQVPTWNATNGDFEPGAGAPNASGIYNVLYNGLVGDGKAVTDAVTNGTTTLTSATANFTSADVGKAIAVRAGGAAGATLVTTISSVTNSTTIVMAAAAGVSSTGLEATYGTDNTSALNTLISGTPTNGATLFFPAGVYCFTGQVIFTAKRITFEGVGYAMSGGGATPLSGAPSVLTYLGAGSGNFLYGGAHTNGTAFEGFQFAWASDKWTGNFITFTNDGGADPAYNVVRDSVFAVDFNGSENTGINLNKSLGGKISNVGFYSLAYGIVGGDNSTGYANGYKISGNSFAFYTTQAIIGSFEGTQFSANIFEASATGVGAAYSDYSTNPSQGLSWTGNWFGDNTSGTAWIIYYGRGISFAGNIAGGASTTDFLDLHAALGFILTGNDFVTFNYVVNCVAATCNGGFAQANTYHALTGGFEGGAANMGTSVNITYNVAF